MQNFGNLVFIALLGNVACFLEPSAEGFEPSGKTSEKAFVCVPDTYECPGSYGFEIARDPEMRCEFPYWKCPEPWYDYDFVTKGSCEKRGMFPITTQKECQTATDFVNTYNGARLVVQSDVTSSNYRDVVDGCSFRPQSGELFWNRQGYCDKNKGSNSWAFRDCKCSELNPCICIST